MVISCAEEARFAGDVAEEQSRQEEEGRMREKINGIVVPEIESHPSSRNDQAFLFCVCVCVADDDLLVAAPF
jgi:hypothetical protein